MINHHWNSPSLRAIFIASVFFASIGLVILSASLIKSGSTQSLYPPIVASQLDEGIQSDLGVASSFQSCGTYFLSLPEKCLVGGEYVPRTDFPDQRFPGIPDD